MATYTNPLTGEDVNVSFGGGWNWTDGYHYNNMFMTSNPEDIELAIGYMLKNGYNDNPEDKKKLQAYLKANGRVGAESELGEIIHDAKKYINDSGIGLDNLNEYYANKSLTTDEQSAQENAYNDYYNDLYSLDEGTLGAQMLGNFKTAEEKAAISNMQLAEAQYQQSAMQQAEVVKSITDQVRSERMARLRAGMSESQIANQDMQVLLNNMGTLNTQMNTMNQNQLAAQQQYNLAQDTAYQQYIQSVTGLGGTSAAMAASDAGDAYMQTKKRQQQVGGTFASNYGAVTNGGK